MGARIDSVGIYMPERRLSNHELVDILAASGEETSDDWIVKRTGMRERRIAVGDEGVESMALEAARDALDRLKREIPPIEHIVIATNSAERMFPNIAGFVQSGLKESHSDMIEERAAGFDLYGGCEGIGFAFIQADAMVQSGFYDTVLVIGSEKLSAITDYSDRGSCVLFGDGAAAYLISKNLGGGGFRGHEARGFGELREALSCENDQEKVDFEEAVLAVREGRAPVKRGGEN
jgi:3-oxoacyl-[acyl-carrier-protein] synthase-3